MSQEVIIKDLILAAAEGASEGVEVLQDADIAVELEEFEIKITYAAETSVEEIDTTDIGVGIKLKILTLKAKIGHTKTSRNKATYGLQVRFLFSGKETAS